MPCSPASAASSRAEAPRARRPARRFVPSRGRAPPASNDVSTVTASTRTRRRLLAAASCAACEHRAPAGRVDGEQPNAERAALRTAPATVFGMSWNLRSRKTSAPLVSQRAHDAGPGRREQLAARPCRSGSCRRAVRASASASAPTETSSATIGVRASVRASRVHSSVPDDVGDARDAMRVAPARRDRARCARARADRAASAVPTPTSDAPAMMYCSASSAERDAADADERHAARRGAPSTSRARRPAAAPRRSRRPCRSRAPAGGARRR